MFIIYVVDLSTKKMYVKMGVHIFTKNQRYRRVEIEKKIQLFLFQKFLIFPVWPFSENGQCFVGAFL